MIYGDHGRLDAVIQTPETQPGHKIPMVIICHGFTGNKDELLLRTLADSLERQGVGSIRFDFNGHGRSDGLFEQMTVPNEIVDTKHVLEYVEHLDYVNRIALAGHSQGGVVAAMTGGELGNGRIDALVLLAPAGVLRDDALRGNTFGKIYDPKNPPETIELWGGRKLGGNYIRTAIGLPIYETAMHYTGPTLVIHGESDRTVPYTYGQRFHYVIKGSEFRLMPDMDHGFSRHEAEVAGSKPHQRPFLPQNRKPEKQPILSIREPSRVQMPPLTKRLVGATAVTRTTPTIMAASSATRGVATTSFTRAEATPLTAYTPIIMAGRWNATEIHLCQPIYH